MMKKNKKLIVGAVMVSLLLLIVCVMVPFDRKDAVVNVSIDDVESSIRDLDDNPEYTSVFQQPFFAFLRDCHLKYNCTFTLYLYANTGGGSLESSRKNLRRILIGSTLAFMPLSLILIKLKHQIFQSSLEHFCTLTRF